MTDPIQEPFLTQDECNELADAMSSKYRIALRDRRFQVQASIKGRGVFVTVLFANQDQSYYYPVEARVMYGKEEMKAREAALFLLDYIDTYFEEYLLEEDEQLYLPIDWADHQYEAIEFQVRGQILNRKLEAMADEWLSRDEDASSRH
ncbi:MAG: hypothetical protein ACOVS5_15515 [Oligoflexus sp.]|jgi:hypothetical protein